jgi:site-specific recombinase XerD
LGENGYQALDQAPRAALKDYCARMVQAGYLPSTINQQIAGVKRFIEWCRMKEMAVPNFYPPELPKINTKIKDILSPQLFARYFELVRELKDPSKTALLLLPCCGLRAEELVSLPLDCLRRTDLQLSEGVKKHTLTIIAKGKGGDEKLVPLLDEGTEAVMAYLKGWRRRHKDTEWLFPGNKEHMSARNLRLKVQKIRQPLGMRFTPHTMRRTYLTSLYRKGVDPVVLAKIAGHKNVKTLVNHYLFLDEFDLAGAVHKSGGSLM